MQYYNNLYNKINIIIIYIIREIYTNIIFKSSTIKIIKRINSIAIMNLVITIDDDDDDDDNDDYDIDNDNDDEEDDDNDNNDDYDDYVDDGDDDENDDDDCMVKNH